MARRFLVSSIAIFVMSSCADAPRQNRVAQDRFFFESQFSSAHQAQIKKIQPLIDSAEVKTAEVLIEEAGRQNAENESAIRRNTTLSEADRGYLLALLVEYRKELAGKAELNRRYASYLTPTNSAPATVPRSEAQPSRIGTKNLRKSGKNGLLSIPLPEGSSLVERWAGDSTSDPFEQYSIDSTFEELLAFFTAAMSSDGWAKDALSTRTTLFYGRGSRQVGILIRSNGSGFRLVRSAQ